MIIAMFFYNQEVYSISSLAAEEESQEDPEEVENDEEDCEDDEDEYYEETDNEDYEDEDYDDEDNKDEEEYDSKDILRESTLNLKGYYGFPGITLKWNGYSPDVVEGFYIYRKDKSTDFKKIGTIKNTDSDRLYNSFCDKNVLPGVLYTYYLAYYYTDTSTQEIIEIKMDTITFELEFDAVELKKVERDEAKVTLNWKKIYGASGYEIYDKAGNGTYKKIADIKKGATQKYVIKNLTQKKKHQLKMRAYVKYNNEILYSPFSKVHTLIAKVTDKQFQKKVNAFKKKHPEGSYWYGVYHDNDGGAGAGCTGFARMLSDAVYGKKAKSKIYKSYSKCKKGTIMFYKPKSRRLWHCVFVLKKTKKYVVVAESNYKNPWMTHWGRKIYLSEIEKAEYTNRY